MQAEFEALSDVHSEDRTCAGESDSKHAVHTAYECAKLCKAVTKCRFFSFWGDCYVGRCKLFSQSQCQTLKRSMNDCVQTWVLKGLPAAAAEGFVAWPGWPHSGSPTVQDITTIITSAPMSLIPDTTFVEMTIRSLWLAGLQHSPVIIGFDGPRVQNMGMASTCQTICRNETLYCQFKRGIRHIADRFLTDVRVIEHSERLCLRNNLRHAMALVSTRYVNVMHHDLPFRKTIRITDVLAFLSRRDGLIPQLVNYVVPGNGELQAKIQAVKCLGAGDEISLQEESEGDTTFAPCGFYSGNLFPFRSRSESC